MSRPFITFALSLIIACTGFAADAPKLPDIKPDVVEKIKAALPEKAFATPKQARKVLVYSKTLGFRHGSIGIGANSMHLLGEKTGAFTIVHSEDPASFDADNLKQFDAILMLNTTGDCLKPKNGKLTDEEAATFEQRKKNFQAFVAGGKGLAGVHSASDTFYAWREYGDMIGAWFMSHPWGKAPLKVDSPNHPLTGMFDASKGFDIQDEIYMFGPKTAGNYQPYSREKLRILLSIDASKMDVKGGAREDKDYGISWIREYEKGRVFYCALGHSDQMYYHPVVLKHYLAGLQYALGDLEADATPSAKVKDAK